MFDWLFGRARRQVSPPTRIHIRGRYDSAGSDDDNRRHWANADALAPNSAITPTVRTTLRNRARYERENNSYAKGIILTLANDCIGTGPRLQMLTEDAVANKAIEAAFESWSVGVGLAEKLRTLRMAKVTDGEGFGKLTTNPRLLSPVKMDVRLVEADQVMTPGLSQPTDREVDGIKFDESGNPETYTIRKQHPGASGATQDVERVAAEFILHFFRVDRPGQYRGIPEITPALSLFAQLRRYTLAVIAAAETAADMAIVIQSDMAPDDAEAPSTYEKIDLERKMTTVLPAGYKLGQTKAEQPATTYAEFKREILNEIARCLNIPYNVAAANSSGYNYASGRLDFQVYFRAIRVEQAALELTILDRIFSAWMAEALLADPTIPTIQAPFPHQWFWDGAEHVDPSKEANAQETRLRNNTTTLAKECAKNGDDWETVLNQRAKEVALEKGLGIRPEPTAAPGAPDNSEDEETETKPDAGKASWRARMPVNGSAR